MSWWTNLFDLSAHKNPIERSLLRQTFRQANIDFSCVTSYDILSVVLYITLQLFLITNSSEAFVANPAYNWSIKRASKSFYEP